MRNNSLKTNSLEGKFTTVLNVFNRQLPTGVDRDTFEQMKTTSPSAETHPNVFAWFTLVKRFTDAVRATWGASAVAKTQEKKPAAAKKVEEEKPKAEAAEDDLFGSDEEEDDEVSCIIKYQIYILTISIGYQESTC